MRTRASMLALVAVWALLVAPFWRRLAHADTGNAELDAAVALYNDLEYEKAVDALNAALAKPGLSKQEQTEGYRILALSQVALGHEDEAKVALQKLLDIDPKFELPRTENQKALDLLDQLRAALPVAPVVSVAQVPSPNAPKAGGAVRIAVTVTDAGSDTQRVIVRHRVQGEETYSSVLAQKLSPGKYLVTIPGMNVKAPALEYFVVAEGAPGKSLATQGTAADPLVLAVAARKGGAPIYAKWWFWTGIGAVLVAGGAAIVLAGKGSSSKSTDATVTINVGP